jgi:hypothetical protein
MKPSRSTAVSSISSRDTWIVAPYLYAPSVRFANAGSLSAIAAASAVSAAVEKAVVVGTSIDSPLAVSRSVGPAASTPDTSTMCSTRRP